MARQHTIALLLELGYEYNRAIIRGIMSYARPTKDWIFTLAPRVRNMAIGQKHDFAEFGSTNAFDGFIGNAASRMVAETLVGLRLPTVNISNLRTTPELPRVGLDDQAIGVMGAQYYVERGFKHLGFVGTGNVQYSVEREAGFAKALAEQGIKHHSFVEYKTARGLPHFPDNENEHILAWLKGLPRPLGLMVANDVRAWSVIQVCRAAGLRVPDDVAVLGVDNDEPLCMAAYPPLGSVATAGERIGYEAAALLDRLFEGGAAPKDPLLIPPRGVITRQSCDVLAIEDLELSAAVRYIREHAHESIGVTDVLQAVPVARRSMERKFRQVLGRSPLEEIRRAHIERARELLAATDLSMPAIAERAGFESAVRLTTVFRQETGTTPTAYRRQFRLHETGAEEEEASDVGEAVESGV